MSVYQTITNHPIQKNHVTHHHVCVNDVFNKDELEKIIEISTKIPLEDGVTNDGIIGPRVSKINHQRPNESNQWIFDKLNQFIMHFNWDSFGYDISGYEFYQYAEYRMEDAGHYDYHVDIMFNGDNLRSIDGIETRKLSMTLLLNEPGVDFEGGEFYVNLSADGCVIDLKAGTAILFPSWLMHKVAPVTKGVRKSLVVWVVGPKFR